MAAGLGRGIGWWETSGGGGIGRIQHAWSANTRMICCHWRIRNPWTMNASLSLMSSAVKPNSYPDPRSPPPRDDLHCS
ncbi:hypothetical protein ACLOJK_000098 [Asimina triloba]